MSTLRSDSDDGRDMMDGEEASSPGKTCSGIKENCEVTRCANNGVRVIRLDHRSIRV